MANGSNRPRRCVVDRSGRDSRDEADEGARGTCLAASEGEATPVSDHRPDRNSRDSQPQDPVFQNQRDSEDEAKGKGHPPLKGTDTPAHTDLEYAEREKGKRTTM
jgi:hypothetical protein